MRFGASTRQYTLKRRHGSSSGDRGRKRSVSWPDETDAAGIQLLLHSAASLRSSVVHCERVTGCCLRLTWSSLTSHGQAKRSYFSQVQTRRGAAAAMAWSRWSASAMASRSLSTSARWQRRRSSQKAASRAWSLRWCDQARRSPQPRAMARRLRLPPMRRSLHQPMSAMRRRSSGWRRRSSGSLWSSGAGSRVAFTMSCRPRRAARELDRRVFLDWLAVSQLESAIDTVCDHQ